MTLDDAPLTPSDVLLTPSRRWRGSDLVGSLLVWLFFCGWTYLATGEVNLREAGVFAAEVLAIVIWGRALPMLLCLDEILEVSFPFVLLLGLAFLGAVLSLARWLVPIELWTLFWSMLALGVFVILVLGFRRGPRGMGNDAAGILATFLALAAATGWVQHYFPPTLSENGSIVYKPIRDNFIHAEQVVLLAQPGGMHATGRYGLAGEPVPFYHYGSYVFPALLVAAGEQNAFVSTISLWLPLGLALVGLAAYVMGSVWFGPRTGIWCLVAILVLPDPSYWTPFVWPLGVYIYSLLRFLQIANSNAYGIAVAAVGLVCITSGVYRSSLRALVLGIFLAGSSLVFKAQIFMAAFPLCAAIGGMGIVFHWHRDLWKLVTARPWWTGGVVLGIVAGLAAFRFTHLWERTPALQLEWPPAERLTEFLITRTLEDPPALHLARTAADLGGLKGFALKLGLVLFVTFRWSLVFIVGVVCGILASRRLRWLDLVAAGSLVVYLSYAMLIAPNITGHAFGNPWDLQFVPFCWVYLILIVWTVGRARELLNWYWPQHRPLPMSLAIWLLLLPITIGKLDTDDWQTGQRWAYLTVPKGLVAASEYIREHAAAGERFQDAENDPYYLVESLTERRAYAGWPVVGSYTAHDRGDQVFQTRLKELAEMRQAKTDEDLKKFVRATGIRWYLMHPQTEVAWPVPILDRPVFESEGFRVYDLDRLSGSEPSSAADAR